MKMTTGLKKGLIVLLSAAMSLTVLPAYAEESYYDGDDIGNLIIDGDSNYEDENYSEADDQIIEEIDNSASVQSDEGQNLNYEDQVIEDNDFLMDPVYKEELSDPYEQNGEIQSASDNSTALLDNDTVNAEVVFEAEDVAVSDTQSLDDTIAGIPDTVLDISYSKDGFINEPSSDISIDEQAPFSEKVDEDAAKTLEEEEEQTDYVESEENLIEYYNEGNNKSYAPGYDGVSGYDLLTQYAQDQLNLVHGSKMLQVTNNYSALNGLNDLEQTIYYILSEQISTVAAGNSNSTKFDITLSDLGLDDIYLTSDDLGVDIIDADYISQAAIDEAERLYLNYNLSNILNALLNTMPYDLYWYDKTVGTIVDGPKYTAFYSSNTGWTLCFDSGLVFSFAVAQEYSAGSYAVDNSNRAAIDDAIANINNIIYTYSGYSDYDKLYNYMSMICNMTSYNYYAADSSLDIAYGNPWQLIWVFDGDDTTSVVCEGYSKAFQYLCDCSTFNNASIESILVSGNMSGGTGAGPHMWNVVCMDDGRNYLVDVTNCDEGTAGAPDLLFISAADGDVYNGYQVELDNGSTIYYSYDNDTINSYGESYLSISAVGYDESEVQDFHYDDTIICDEIKNVYVTAGQEYILKFIPENSGYYSFYSSNTEKDTYGTLYNANGDSLKYDDDSGEGQHFRIVYYMEAYQTYYLAARYYSSSNSGSFDVTIEKQFQIISINDVNVEGQLIENYDGYERNEQIWDADQGDYIDYQWFYYDLGNLDIVFSVETDDPDNHEFEGTASEIYSEFGMNIQISDDQSYDHPWTIGLHTITAAIYDIDLTCEFEVEVVENPVSSIIVAPIQISESTHGYWDTYYDGTDELQEYFYYGDLNYWNDLTQSNNLEFSIVYKGEVYIGDSNEIYSIVGQYPSYTTLNQSYNNQWVVGNTYKAQATLMGKSCEFDVEIVKNPIESILVVPIKIMENTHGYWETYYNDAGELIEYYYYNDFDFWDDLTQAYNLKYILVYNGETFTGDRDEIYSIVGETPSYTPLNQDSNNRWTAGNIYTAMVTLSGKSCEFEVEITESPIESISVAPIQIIEHTHGYETSDWDDEAGEWAEYFHYSWFDDYSELMYTIVYNDETYTGDRNEMYSIIGEYPSCTSIGQNYNNQWIAGNTYTAKATLLGKTCEFEVEIIKSPIKNISVAAIQIIENTHGYWESYYDETGEEREYFYYGWLNESNELLYTIEYNGEIYSGDSDEIYSIVGEYPSYSSVNQDYNNQWTVGNTYTARITLLGKTCELDVEIVESPLESISVTPIQIIENTHGYWDTYYDETDLPIEYYYYNDLDFWNDRTQSYNLQYTIIYNGETYIGDQDYIYSIFDETPSCKPIHNDYKHQWIVGNTYTAMATFMGKSCEFEVEIKESPVQSITVAPIQIIENTHGYEDTYWEDDTGESVKYYYYSDFDYWDGRIQSNNLQYTIVYNGETYTGNSDEMYTIVGEYPSCSSLNQNYFNQWTVGNTYKARATLMGKSCEFNVEIIKSPVESISVAPVKIIENTRGYEETYWDEKTEEWKEYYYYWNFDYWNNSTQSNNLQYTIVYNGETFTGNRHDVYSIVGEYPSYSSLNQDYDNQWIVGNTYKAQATLLGISCEFDVEIIEYAEIEISDSFLTLVAGDSVQLEATILPEGSPYKEIIWLSSNENIARVDENGLVTAVGNFRIGEGNNAIISASSEDGTISAMCYVTVLFSDVAGSSYYYEPVYWALRNEITNGAGGAGLFSPVANCTREQVVTFLWRLMGQPEPSGHIAFTDVSEGAWYDKPISWAYENGITTGLNDGTGRFGVGQPCTREMVVTFLWRAIGKPSAIHTTVFTDATDPSRYFYDPVSWAAQHGITVGLNDGTGRFGIGMVCSRAMIVTFLYRFANIWWNR